MSQSSRRLFARLRVIAIFQQPSGKSDINQLGYSFINAKKLDQAILVLKLNVDIYPESFNTWDSLGEAYMDRGDKDLAIQNYSKSLELNPNNHGARTQLASCGRSSGRFRFEIAASTHRPAATSPLRWQRGRVRALLSRATH
jgi:Flp pilus assembly protein TadD